MATAAAAPMGLHTMLVQFLRKRKTGRSDSRPQFRLLMSHVAAGFVKIAERRFGSRQPPDARILQHILTLSGDFAAKGIRRLRILAAEVFYYFFVKTQLGL